ncbi:hypothetical protein [Domibacillus indicus]|uniref:hypothetical protein n=1 Tax=Domibacillus indicus TaxID=1437523 RepID=UPI000617C6EC|nr:hypothetical protein [Domibacillus indicus]
MAIHKEPIDYIRIPAPQHSKDAFYEVRYGDVDWDDSGEENKFQRAVYVVMGYGEKLSYRRVAHILTTANPEENGLSDLEKVLAAIEKIKKRNNL